MPPCTHFDSNNEPAADVICSNGESSSCPSTPILHFACCSPEENRFLAKIQQDLNSPSAALRVRAIKALSCPCKSPYMIFDVSHEEQDIITEEERKSPIYPKSIEEVMKDVVVYVEVRTDEDNRSSGVMKVISLLGAKVNNTLLRNTTHVIFKDGRLSTYKKAKKWNIPVVSILWIEACKEHLRLMSTKNFPISNLHWYENPEQYGKMKRYKFRQPGSEETRRSRKPKAKATTKKNGGNTKPTKKNTGLTFFLTKARNVMSNKIHKGSHKTRGYFRRSLTYLKSVSGLFDTVELIPKPGASKTMHGNEEITSSTASTNGTPSHWRNSIQGAQTPEKVNENVPSIESSISATPGVRTRKRKSIHNPTKMIITTQKGDKSSKLPVSKISEQVADNFIQEGETPRTTYTDRSIDSTTNTPLQMLRYTLRPMEESKLPSPTTWTSVSVYKPRTVFATTSKSYEGQSITGDIPSSTLVRGESVNTFLQFSSTLEEHAPAIIFSSTKTPANPRRRKLFDVSMDIINQNLQNINQSAKSLRVVQTYDRRSYQDDTDTTAALLTPTDNNNMPIRRELFIEGENSSLRQPSTAADISSQADTATTTTTPIESPVKKTRKLFVPNEILLPFMKTPVDTKRRRTMPNLTESKTEQKKRPPKNKGTVACSQEL